MYDVETTVLTFREAFGDYRIGDTLQGEAALKFKQESGADPSFYFVVAHPASVENKE